VTAEHVSIDAVTATVHCDDLKTMEGFLSVLSISKDAVVRADGAAAAAKPKKSVDAGAQQARLRTPPAQRKGRRPALRSPPPLTPSA